MIGIYKITSPSGRVYIGQATNVQRRFKEYLKLQNCKKQTVLYKSFLKHGVENHIFEIIEECAFDQLNIRERHWQDHYDVLNGGLNCILTSTQTLPVKWSCESNKKKGSKGEKNFFYGKNYGKSGKDNPMFGKEVSTYTRQLISKRSKGIFLGSKNPMFGTTGDKCPSSKIVLDTQTGIFFDCAKDAAETYNVKHSTLRGYLNGGSPNKTDLIYC